MEEISPSFHHRAPSPSSLPTFHHRAPSPAFSFSTLPSQPFSMPPASPVTMLSSSGLDPIKAKNNSNSFYVGNVVVDNGVKSYSQGNYDEAIKQFSTALKMQRLTLGNEHICVAHTLGNIGAVLLSQERYKEATSVLEESLHIKKALLKSRDGGNANTLPYGCTTIKISDTFNNLGNAAFLDGKNHDAMTHYQNSLNELTSGEIPGSVTEIVNCLHNIGNVHCSLYELDEALLALNETLQLIQSTNGMDDLKNVDTLEKIGSIYMNLNRLDEAMTAFSEALRVTKTSLGHQHVDCAPLMYNIGMVYQATGDRDRAIQSFSAALEIYGKNGVEDEYVGVVRQKIMELNAILL